MIAGIKPTPNPAIPPLNETEGLRILEEGFAQPLQAPTSPTPLDQKLTTTLPTGEDGGLEVQGTGPSAPLPSAVDPTQNQGQGPTVQAAQPLIPPPPPPGVINGLKAALDRQRDFENSPFMGPAREMMRNEEAMRMTRSARTIPGYIPRVESTLIAVGANETEEEARVRDQTEWHHEITMRETARWVGVESAMSFGLMDLATRNWQATLSPEALDQLQVGKAFGMFAPTPLNLPISTFNLLSKGIRKPLQAGIEKGIKRATLEVAERMKNIAEPTSFLEKVGYLVMDKAFKRVRPQTLQRAEDAMRAARGQIQQGGVYIPDKTGQAGKAAQQALEALRLEAGHTLPLKFLDQATAAMGDAPAMGLVNVGFHVPGAIFAPTAEEREANLKAMPGAFLMGAALPLALRGLANAPGVVRGIKNRATPYDTVFNSVSQEPQSVRLFGSPGQVITPGARPTPGPPGPSLPAISLRNFRATPTPVMGVPPKLTKPSSRCQRRPMLPSPPSLILRWQTRPPEVFSMQRGCHKGYKTMQPGRNKY